MSKSWIRAGAIALTLITGLGLLINWGAQYLWLEALGYESVFWRLRPLKLGLFLAAFIFSFLYLAINLRFLSAYLDLPQTPALERPGGGSTAQAPGTQPPLLTQLGGGVGPWFFNMPIFMVMAAAVLALIAGLVFAGSWDLFLRYRWSQHYGQSDPIFGQDIGFYLFELPFLELVQDGLLMATFLAAIALFTTYSHFGRLTLNWREGLRGPSNITRHLSINLSLFLGALAWGYYLDRFGLLQAPGGAVYGAGYTDAHVTRPALFFATGATLALAIFLHVPLPKQRKHFPLLPLGGGYLAILSICLGIVPWGVQSFYVEPNELELETPFLHHNIALTREAYRLHSIVERSYSPRVGLTSQALESNQETIGNIRLWDWRPLGETFQQLQRIRAYYDFSDVDVDRYFVDGTRRQVMLAARELSPELPGKAETWVNHHLQYTHGYGLAMSLTAEKQEQGKPVLIVKDLPPVTESGLSSRRPGVYYGQTPSDYRIVATSVPEFDYPRGDDNVYASYDGQGGVLLDSYWKRLLFSLHQFDVNILISSYVTPASRIQLWRQIQDRVHEIAPFLRLDDDPYLVVGEDQFYWIQDAYTDSNWFPYAEPHDGGLNYIRNAVKVVIDAYDGGVTFYVMEPDDPVLMVYRDALPALFQPLSQMPEEIRQHLRYPQDLFQAQIDKYSRYHMTVPQVFYNNEDLWAVPWERYGGEEILMDPYYVLMQLPREQQLQFLLMMPLTPHQRGNMIAWVAARGDFPNYGELIAYKLPKERLILGPIQVEAMINQDPLISQQLSLWDQRGSRVIRGNLLVIPIDQLFLYVEPVYLVAEGTSIPELKRVIVSDGARVAMQPTLAAGLEALLGVPALTSIEAPVVKEPHDERLVRAKDALKAAETALREGDWTAFGAAMDRLRNFLGE